MLKKVRNLRAIRPGRWARIVVPDFECWKEGGDWREVGPGGTVDACIIPMYGPAYRSATYFEWKYRAAFRCIGKDRTGQPHFEASYCRPGGAWINPHDLGMVEALDQRPFWTKEESELSRQGKGAWLYEPASEDPALCPGPDCSLYLCETCGEYRMPFSDDEGNLLCMACEVEGLIVDPEYVGYLEEVREFARSVGLSRQLARQLTRLDRRETRGHKAQCWIGRDFAPHSFSFAHWALPSGTLDGKRHHIFNGGLVYSGPGSPGDGSFSSPSISLAEASGWFCHK
jgi:hypothetical protein